MLNWQAGNLQLRRRHQVVQIETAGLGPCQFALKHRQNQKIQRVLRRRRQNFPQRFEPR